MPAKPKRLMQQLLQLRQQAQLMEQQYLSLWQSLPASQQASARNLLHYLSLRQHDIRSLQQELSGLGLSSLGVLEAHVLDQLNTVIFALAHLTGQSVPDAAEPPLTRGEGRRLLQSNADRLLGAQPEQRQVRIMVTMPAEAAHDANLLRNLLQSGMDIMRINCAHDTPADWLAMIANLQEAIMATGRPCLVQADLAGPKLRTGQLASSGRVLKIKPRRNVFGQVVAPAQIWLTPLDAAEPAPDRHSFVLPVSTQVLTHAQEGDRLLLCDTRADEIELVLIRQQGQSWLAETSRTTYIEPHTPVSLWRRHTLLLRGNVGEVPDIILPILLNTGDMLVLTRADSPGENAKFGSDGSVLQPAHIHCSLASAFEQVTAGQRVWLDDGKIGGIIQNCSADTIEVRITHAGPDGSKLKAGKGINFPDTVFHLPALTEKDKSDLSVLLPHIDLVALSFLRNSSDIEALQEFLRQQGKAETGMILKIENRQAFQQLPHILFSSMQYPPFGVMVARGDLAVEMGFERLSEVQEEILWLCEAAHVPVIWATQILEGMAKKGAPSRAEVSDAAMSIRAECAMLNKGPHIVETVRFLAGIIGRMESHYFKRRATLRKLSVASTALGEAE